MRVGLVLSAAIFHLLSSACSDVSALDLGLEGARAEALLGAQVDNKKPVATGTGTGTGRRPKSFEKDCLAAHNKWRKIHQANPLKIDHKVSEFRINVHEPQFDCMLAARQSNLNLNLNFNFNLNPT